MCGFLLQPKQSTQQLRVCFFFWKPNFSVGSSVAFAYQPAQSPLQPLLFWQGVCVFVHARTTPTSTNKPPLALCVLAGGLRITTTLSAVNTQTLLLCYCVTFSVWMASLHLCFISLYIPASLLYFCRRSIFNVANYHKQTQTPHGNTTG